MTETDNPPETEEFVTPDAPQHLEIPLTADKPAEPEDAQGADPGQWVAFTGPDGRPERVGPDA